MKSTTNVFLGGLKTDFHPLSIQKGFLTDALNATLITYNGNEMMLLNDMGNAKIQDSTTGNIMGLRNGFIPLGMKEHGGVLYIASYNDKTKEGELGTIPSPVFNYTYDDAATNTSISNPLLSGSLYKGTSLIDSILKYDLYSESAFKLVEEKLEVGDLVLIALQIKDIDVKTSRTSWFGQCLDSIKILAVEYPLISQVKKAFDPLDSLMSYAGYGWFALSLVAKTLNSESETPLPLYTNKAAKYYLTSSGLTSSIESDYWFINEDITKLDLEATRATGVTISYPNILPGYLYGKVEPELPEQFDWLPQARPTVCVIYPIELS